MQKVIYFTPIPETGKLSTIITDKSPEELIEQNIIPSNSKYVIEDYNHLDEDQLTVIYHIGYMLFNDTGNPTSVVLNKDLLVTAVIEDIRTKRIEHLDILDSLQFRASVMNRTNVVEQIENDKIILRNLPNTVDFSDRHTIRKIYSACPPELFIDYKAKYEAKLK